MAQLDIFCNPWTSVILTCLIIPVALCVFSLNMGFLPGRGGGGGERIFSDREVRFKIIIFGYDLSRGKKI